MNMNIIIARFCWSMAVSGSNTNKLSTIRLLAVHHTKANITTNDGNQLIKELCNTRKSEQHLLATRIINNAFDIYKQIKTPDHVIMANIIRLCSVSKEPHRAMDLWEDIQHISSQNNLDIKTLINLNMSLLDTVLKSNKINGHKGRKILEFLVGKTHKLHLKIHGNTSTNSSKNVKTISISIHSIYPFINR